MIFVKKINNRYRYLLILLTFIGGATAFGQNDSLYIGEDYSYLNWQEFTRKAEKNLGIRFFYNPDSIPDIITPDIIEPAPLPEILADIFSTYSIKVTLDNSGNLFLTKDIPIILSFDPGFFPVTEDYQATDYKQDTSYIRGRYLQTNNEYIPRTIVVGNKKEGFKSGIHSVTGYVRSAIDSTPIVNATLFIEETETGTTSDASGLFTATLRKGKYTLIVNSLGTVESKFRIEVLSDGRFEIFLEPKLYLLDEFVVRSNMHHNVKGTQMGVQKLSTREVKEIPVVMGEKDIVKVALLLPGVQSVGEGSAGFNVRGSPVDQNLFYINDVPVYNPSHFLGFFSSFNSDAINDFTLIKSNIPASYGGRISSIFDINARQGDLKKFSLRGGISPVAARIMAEGPFVKEKHSYLISARATYSDWILQLSRNPDVKKSGARFSDFSANLSFTLDDKNKLNIFAYYSDDETNIASRTLHQYSNAGASASWLHFFNNKHTGEITYTYYQYGFREKNTETDVSSYKQSFDLNHNEIKASLKLRPNEKHEITAGINSVLYGITRGDFTPLTEESLLKPIYFEPERGIESGIFLSEDWKINNNLEVNVGLRYNIYSYLGPKTIFHYREGYPRERENITDTSYYSGNSPIRNYTGLDYRVAMKYLITEDISFKASYNRLHQYIFLLSNTIAVSPTAYWKLCDYHIDPMRGDQYSAGVYANFLGNYLETSIEGYYKKVDNLVEYKDGANLIVNEIPEIDIVQGNLESYGVEVMIKKPYGRINGWINYTYSRAKVTVNNPGTGEQNNFGFTYPANYDKPHAFNIVAVFKVSRRFSFSGNIVYSTGRPVTYPTALYYQNGMQVTHYSLRNEYRLPDYFRADLSINIEGSLKKKKLIHGSWAVSLYNVTGRKNAYSVYFKSEDGNIKAYKISIFGVPIFSITYNFKLGNYED